MSAKSEAFRAELFKQRKMLQERSRDKWLEICIPVNSIIATALETDKKLRTALMLAYKKIDALERRNK